MKSKTFVIGLILVVLAMLGTTVYCGWLTERWAPFAGLDETRDVLKSLPMTIGDWEAEEELSLAKGDITMLRIENGYISRQYRNSRNQATVNLVIMVGQTGRVVVHTPETCFGGRNYEKEDGKEVIVFPIEDYSGSGPPDDKFWKVNFVNRAAQGGTISFYYATSVGDAWVASDNPRNLFRRYRYAYRIQAESRVEGEADNVAEFLTDCLPVIHEHLRPCR